MRGGRGNYYQGHATKMRTADNKVAQSRETTFTAPSLESCDLELPDRFESWPQRPEPESNFSGTRITAAV